MTRNKKKKEITEEKITDMLYPSFKEIHDYDVEGKIWCETNHMEFKTFDEHKNILDNIVVVNKRYSDNVVLHDIQRLSKTLSYIAQNPSLIIFFDNYRKHIIPIFIKEAKHTFEAVHVVAKIDEMIKNDSDRFEREEQIDDEYSHYDIISNGIQELFYEMSLLRFTIKKIEKIINVYQELKDSRVYYLSL